MCQYGNRFSKEKIVNKHLLAIIRRLPVADMIELRYESWDGKTHRHALSRGRMTVGRLQDNDVVIDELEVSGRHCEIEVTLEGASVRDLDSSSGTYVDGAFVVDAPLKPGQVLNLGSFSVRIEAVSDEESNRAAASRPQDAPVQLADGTYSCMRHRETRAAFECEDCYRLFCPQCFPSETPVEEPPDCPRCRIPLRPLDWSGLDTTRKDVIKGLIPGKAKRAWGYWRKIREYRQKKE